MCRLSRPSSAGRGAAFCRKVKVLEIPTYGQIQTAGEGVSERGAAGSGVEADEDQQNLEHDESECRKRVDFSNVRMQSRGSSTAQAITVAMGPCTLFPL